VHFPDFLKEKRKKKNAKNSKKKQLESTYISLPMFLQEEVK
jgi:hypothetical protein